MRPCDQNFYPERYVLVDILNGSSKYNFAIGSHKCSSTYRDDNSCDKSTLD